MHVTLTPTCMIFLSQFRSIEFFHFYGLYANFISETEKATPTKMAVHACDINPYLHEFIEPIPKMYANMLILVAWPLWVWKYN